jgi:hypothetical protein
MKNVISFIDSQIATSIKTSFYNFPPLKLNEKYNRLNFDNWHFFAVSVQNISPISYSFQDQLCRKGTNSQNNVVKSMPSNPCCVILNGKLYYIILYYILLEVHCLSLRLLYKIFISQSSTYWGHQHVKHIILVTTNKKWH